MIGRRGFGYSLLLPALVLIALFLVVPILMTVFTSLYVDTPLAPRRFVALQNYVDLARDDVARGTFGFTFLFVAVSTTLELLLGLLLALLVHESFRGRGLVRAVVLIPWAIPTVVAAVMWKYMLNDQYGFFNLLLYGGELENYRAWLASAGSARAAIIAADVWKTTAFPALILLAGLQAIPEELYEAARVDCAGAFRRFFAITLPLLKPALLVAFLFRMMDAFRVFDLVYVLTHGAPGDATNVLQFYGYQKMFPEQQFGYGSAVSVVVFLVILGISLVFLSVVGRRMFER
jgi:multiple sugar transport system permease protein